MCFLWIHTKQKIRRVGRLQFLGTFAKLRKAIISFVKCLSVRKEQLGF